jgi:CxxC-x17-CxxC domain-containing protein
MYQDQTLKCEDCGSDFTFTVGEQEFYAEKGLVNKPKRCNDCRSNRKQRNKKKLFPATCSECGIETQVPFKPVMGKEIYCKDCYAKRQ